LCEYADLFASFAPNFISDDQAIGQLDEASFVFPVLDGPTATGLLSTSLARGPPSA
jgi:hypothetical protein